jgi:DNA repair photolyase
VKSGQFELFPEIAAQPTLRDVADAVRAAGIDGLPDARRRADEARYQEVHVKSALTRTVGMPYFEWALNPYRGCTHACEYCYARKYQRHLELGAGEDFSSMIFVKTNLPDVLRREVTRPAWARQTVAVGTATDPYQPIEGHYRITRRCLDVFASARTPVSIITKGPMIVRDIDVLREIGKHAKCHVSMSVASVDEDAWTRLEPGTASPAQRLRAVRQLTDAGVEAGVLMMPLVPGITTSQSSVERTLRAIADAGATFIGTNVAHLEDGVREHFLAFLSRDYPALVEGYGRLYQRKYAPSDYVAQVKAMVEVLVRKTGLGSRKLEAGSVK